MRVATPSAETLVVASAATSLRVIQAAASFLAVDAFLVMSSSTVSLVKATTCQVVSILATDTSMAATTKACLVVVASSTTPAIQEPSFTTSLQRFALEELASFRG